MPTKIVDLSARSEVIRQEPFSAHFWECTPLEFKAFRGRPRKFLQDMGIALPDECRIETTIENHERLGEEAANFDGEGDEVICNLGRGDIGQNIYHVTSYTRDKAAAGQVRKKLLHKPDREQVRQKDEHKRKRERRAD